jgi:hypothetical protein
VIAGLGVGAEQGYVYLRSEYPDAIEVMERAVEIARGAGFWATCWARAAASTWKSASVRAPMSAARRPRF